MFAYRVWYNIANRDYRIRDFKIYCKEVKKINRATITNLIIVLLVLAGIFSTMSPETHEGYNSFIEITIGAVAVFVVITIVRMIMANRRK